MGLFTEIASSAGSAAAILAAREEAFRAVRDVALRAAAKAAREKLLVLASKKQLTLSTAWKPTALISVINARTDLTDMEKVKLAAKAKLEGNLNDLLPQKFIPSEKKKEMKEEPKEETYTIRDGN